MKNFENWSITGKDIEKANWHVFYRTRCTKVMQVRRTLGSDDDDK